MSKSKKKSTKRKRRTRSPSVSHDNDANALDVGGSTQKRDPKPAAAIALGYSGFGPYDDLLKDALDIFVKDIPTNVYLGGSDNAEG